MGDKRSHAGKAATWQGIASDPKTPSHLRSSIEQQRNRGVPWSNISLKKFGYELAHIRGCEAKKGFDYSYTVLQSTDLHKNQHRFDSKGSISEAPLSVSPTKNRPLLLLFLSIDDSVAFSRELEAKRVKHSVLNELPREDEDYIVFRAGQPGAVTVATNTAGRGTDVVLSPASHSAGGLHVAFTFFPENFRVECQGLGRAGRQGEPGTAEICTSLDDPFVRNNLYI